MSATIRRRVRAGLHPVNHPLGYICRKTVVELDPDVAPLIAEAIRLMGTGKWSVRKLHAHMTEKGLRGKGGRMLAISSFHEMLTNRFYAGYVGIDGAFFPGRHEPIVSTEELEASSKALKRRLKRSDACDAD
jgi:hypothetical protein